MTAVRGNWNRASILPPDDSHALPPGHWETRRCVRVYVLHICDDCGGHLTPGDRCDMCLTWAVKNARDFEWARMSRANRGVVWTVLDARKLLSEEAA